MTYNIQQGVDFFGNKNFEGQLGMIQEIDPDILCLQESDASRISGGNSDVVRYFAEHLGYYTYYGPKTVTGTYGTAILSRFPMDSCQTVFTYSDKDEIGTAVAVIFLADQNITLINSHPAGGKKAREEHIDMVTQLAKDNKMVIDMGDYNFRQNSPYYQKITTVLKDSWLTLYPDAIGPVDNEKIDLSFENRNNSSGMLLSDGKLDMKGRIDHIFLSKDFEVKEAHYLPSPESETDHPAHWAIVRWDK
jgi:endonuclease/exonuclease/phosphatase family metal-dependent hydrolase